MSKNFTLKILTHELDDIISELVERYHKTWFRKKYYKRLANMLHEHCYPSVKGELIE